MRKLVKTVNVATDESGEETFFLDYYILEKEVQVEGISISRFGLEIYKRAQRKDGTPYAEYRKVFDVFQTEAEANEVLHLLARNTVTPVSMKEILEDLLGCSDFSGEALLVEAV
ncbi:MAG: hypothetical protein IKD21_06670 [Clostridia bacterium]|nr:hypothetical protein [Clostridia bacterium]